MAIIRRNHDGVFRDKPATGHNHTYYSTFDGGMSPAEYANQAAKLGYVSIALNDHGTLLGILPFIDACKEAGLNAVPGIEAYSKVCDEVLSMMSDYAEKNNIPNLMDFMDGRTHLIVDAKTYRGYQLISYASRDANTHLEKVIKLPYPIMTCDILEKYFKGSDDIFGTSACVQGAIGYILLTNYRIKRKMSKEEAICASNKEAYETWVEFNSQLKNATEELKELKKQKTALAKYLKPTFAAKIEKLKTAVDGQIGLFDAKAEKKRSDLEDATTLKAKSESELPLIEARIAELEKQKVEAKAKADEAKAGYNKYVKAKEKIDGVSYVDEAFLYECAKVQLNYYKSVFNTFFVEVQNHGIDNEAYVMPILVKLAEETNTPIIAANDAHIKDNTEDSIEARRIVRYNYFNRSQTVDDADREMYIKTDWELIDALSMVIPEAKAEEAVRNTDIFNQCNVVFPKESHYPSVKTGEPFDTLLEKAREKKIAAGEWNDVYEARLRHEINVIKTMGYVDYHMVVRDFCNEARVLGRIPKEELANMPTDDFEHIHQWIEENHFSNGVGVGPGRGSAAGSLVCYLLGITNIDPIKYSLLFERFLNPERVSMPDIDSDIKTSLRPTIIKYLKWKYGEKAVCSIATETTYGAKGAVQMAGRERASQLYDHLPEKEAKPLRQTYMYGTTLKISDLIPETPGITLADCEEEVMREFGNNAEAMIVWNHAKLIEGKIQGTGVHAGGVIISDNDNVNDYVALAWNEEKQVWAAQCDMVKAEEIGLLKMDLLGLSTLDCISDTIHLVKKYRGVDIDIDAIPFEPEVFANIYATGNTNSVFQFESAGMKTMLKDFKPTCFEDLIVLVACYRPGPMQYLQDIIEVKNGRKELTYKTPELESILSATYGATVYQEQVMQIFQKLAGYSLGAADMVRRAMSKKKTEKLAHEREAFINGDEKRNIDGCVKRGISEKIANTLFDEMMDFARYAFNKSHAAAYAYVSYQTAWLKYHYPIEYLCAMFNNKSQDAFEPLFADANMYGIKVLTPDINASHFDFVIEDDAIRYGLGSIKGVGEANKPYIAKIADERNNGMYSSIHDFLKRNLICDGGRVTIPSKKVLEGFINSGAFDSIGYNRQSLLESVQSVSVSVVDTEDSDLDAVQVAKETIDTMPIPMMNKDVAYNMSKEVEYLGSILSENPLEMYGDDENYGCTRIDQLTPGAVTIFGFVTSAELKKSAKGKKMLLLNIQGKTGSCNIIGMNNVYDAHANNIEDIEYHVVKVKGSANDSTVFANEITLMPAFSDEYYLELTTPEDTEFVAKLRANRADGGNIKVTVAFHYNKKGKLNVPIVREYKFTEAEVASIKKHGIAINQWNGRNA